VTTYRKTLSKKESLSPGVREYLVSGDTGGSLDAFLLSDDEAAKIWESVNDELLADFIRKNPGRRPWGWWRWTAPRAVVDPSTPRWIAERMPEPRKRLGGIGTPKHDALAVAPSYDRGIPVWWISAFDVAYYNGRAKDIHGKRIGEQYEEGHFPYQAIDPADPPVFESEANYLKRLNLFAPGEEARLTKADFADEVIGPEDDDESSDNNKEGL